MKVSVHTSVLDRDFNSYETLDMLKTAGFDGYNFSTAFLGGQTDSPLGGDNYVEEAKRIKAYADKLGLAPCATHSPFPTGFKAAEKNKPRFDLLVKSIEITSLLGATHTVIHPMQQLTYREHKAELKKMNYDFYMALLPYAQKFGVKIAVENMWQWRYSFAQKITDDSVCSTAEEFCEYVDMLPREHFCACLDLGHVQIVGEDMEYMIRTLGDRIEVIHVHDNDLAIDDHTLPFLGKMDFDMIFKTLKEIGYKGDLNFECGDFFAFFPKELTQSTLNLTADVGKYLRDTAGFDKK